MRFVVLHHRETESPHFDLLIEPEAGSANLWTWRCPQWPPEVGDELHRLRDHRRLYLSYEGQISGERGTVSRVEEGDCVIDQSEPGVLSILFQMQMHLVITSARGAGVSPGDRWIVSEMTRDAGA